MESISLVDPCEGVLSVIAVNNTYGLPVTWAQSREVPLTARKKVTAMGNASTTD